MGIAHDAATWSFYLVAVVWWTVELGYGPLQLVLLGSVLEVTLLLSEVPTGVVADRFSRKWSVVISYVIMAVAIVLSAATLNYGVMLGAQALFGIGWTFRSGADVAWLTDEMTWRSRQTDGSAVETDQSRVLLRRHRLGMASGVVVLVPTIYFGRGSLREVIVIAGVVLAIAAVVLAVTMTDHFRQGQTEDEHTLTAREILRDGFQTARRVRSIRLLLIVMLLLGLGGDALDRLGFKQFLDDGDFGDDSLLWTGLLFIVLGALGVVVVWFTERALARGVELAVLAFGLLIISAAGAFVAAVAPVIGIAIGMAMQDPCREALDPVTAAWANREAPEASRATVHSFVSQAQGIGRMTGGIALASLAELTNIRWAIFGAAGLWLIASAVCSRERSASSVTELDI